MELKLNQNIPGITLRDYQEEGIKGIYNSWKTNRRVCYQLPTGGGKTSIFSFITKMERESNPHKKVLLVAHRKELINQMHTRLGQYGVSSWELFGGKLKNPDYPVQCSSVQTLARQHDKYWPEDVGLVILDEAHHAIEGSGYDDVLQRYPDARVLGVTATPCRLDGKGLDYMFEDLICGPSVQTMIDQGYLSPFRAFRGMSPNLKGAKVRHGDYQLGDLAERANTKVLLGDLIRSWKEKAEGLSTIVFAVNVAHSQSIVARYLEAGIPAEHIDGTTPSMLRRQILDRFRRGETLVLSNCAIVTEGFDVPACACVQMARPTKSLSLYLQAVGRGLRPLEGKTAIILDHAGVTAEHGLPSDGHTWTLKGVEKQERNLVVDPETDELKNEEEVEPPEILEAKTVELVEVGQGYQERIRELFLTAEVRGYKKQWVYHRVLEIFNDTLTVDHLKFVAKEMGYHWRWAVHKFEEWKQEQHQKRIQFEEEFGVDW